MSAERRDDGARRPAGAGGRGVRGCWPPRPPSRTPSSRLLAFCAHDDERRRRRWTPSGPGRSSPAARRRPPAAGSRSSASPRPTGPLRTPADEAAGILTRLMLPVRHAGRTRGYLWLLDGGRIDPDDADRPRARRRGRTSPPRPAGCWPSGPPTTRTSAGRWPPRSPAAPAARAAAAPAASPRPWARRPPRCSSRSCPAPAGCPPDGSGRRPARSTAIGDGAAVAVLVPLPGAGDLRPAGALAVAALAGLPAGQHGRGVARCGTGFADLRGPVGGRPAPRPGWPPPCRASRPSRTGPSSAPGGW